MASAKTSLLPRLLAIPGFFKAQARRIMKPLQRRLRRIGPPEQIISHSHARKQLRPWRAQLLRLVRPDVIYVGVTGSCGKATTTRLIGAVLSSGGECRTDAGRNGPKRVVDNLLTISARTRFCIQELSGSRPGRIRMQTKFLRPQVGVITTVGSDHYKNFRSLDATASEKGAAGRRAAEARHCHPQRGRSACHGHATADAGKGYDLWAFFGRPCPGRRCPQRVAQPLEPDRCAWARAYAPANAIGR